MQTVINYLLMLVHSHFLYIPVYHLLVIMYNTDANYKGTHTINFTIMVVLNTRLNSMSVTTHKNQITLK
jgi:hypothetical protein